MKRRRIIVIGGGIVGLASALKLSRRVPGAEVVVLEKEEMLGRHQTGNNSGVLHAGLYYKPGSLKARLAVEGLREMVSFCQEHGVAHEICGKLVVATDDGEVERLKALQARGTQNGLAGLKWVEREEIQEFEPHAAGLAALRVPQEGIVDYAGAVRAMAGELEQMGQLVVTGAKVTRIEEREGAWRVESAAGSFEGDYLLNCAGLYCDRVSEMAGEKREVRIVPFRGEYYKLKREREFLVKNLIYPVPDPQFPFLGVHFTRLIGGGIEAGPNAVLAFAREGYRKTDVHAGELWDAITYGGLWKFMAKHKRMTFEEMRRSLSKRLFCESLRKLVPEVREEDLEPGGAGVRAQAMSPEGELVQDFSIVERAQALHVLNAPSPAATASLAIGGEIAERVAKGMGL